MHVYEDVCTAIRKISEMKTILSLSKKSYPWPTLSLPPTASVTRGESVNFSGHSFSLKKKKNEETGLNHC